MSFDHESGVQSRLVPKHGERFNIRAAFTLVELLVVVAILSLLASLLLPGLARAQAKRKAVYCFNNLRQLGIALQIYAGDHDDSLPYNMGTDGTHRTVAAKGFLNWANNVMTWELDSENTNAFYLKAGGLGPYVGSNHRLFKCPSDIALSGVQKEAGWTERVRSVSMNAMLGNAGEFMQGGGNTNNPTYRQFLRQGNIPAPSRIFALVEEHPDSINDGYFLNKFYSRVWIDLPASYHNGSANFVFADGHAESHRWLIRGTMPAAKPDAAELPRPVPSNEKADLSWVLSRTSVE